MKKMLIEIEILGDINGCCLPKNIPEKNKLYCASDGVIYRLVSKNEDDCVFDMPIPISIMETHITGVLAYDHERRIDALCADIKLMVKSMAEAQKSTSVPAVESSVKGVSEDLLLKAIALARSPELIKDIE